MAWQTMMISNPAKLSIKNRNILVSPEENGGVSVAADEISCIVIEHQQVVMTAPFLAICAQKDIALFVCDKKHTPAGVLLPFHSHSRFSKVSYMQINWSEPFKKRAWQYIIQAKIANQAALLQKIGSDAAKVLTNMQKKVTSGDMQNIESQAARLYFDAMFDDFYRGMPEIRSSALDYGYAIIRGAIARTLSSGGFLPSFGLHHSSELNAFNLADDIIEPFRPFVDLRVYEMFGREMSQPFRKDLAKEERIRLVDILNYQIALNKEKTTVLSAIQSVCYSLLRATKEKDSKLLTVPEFAHGI